MIDQLSILKSRIESIQYGDLNSLDDIKRKTKMYLENIFPNKFTYFGEVDSIKFTPTYVVSGMDSQVYIEAWNNGKNKLRNLLDTRIEEAKIEAAKLIANTPTIKVVEKIVRIEDHGKINELNKQLSDLKAQKSLWNKINYLALGGIILTLLGGSFLGGKYFGENRFDKEKIDLLFENRNFKKSIDSLKSLKEKEISTNVKQRK